MKYRSTRGNSPTVNFVDVLLNALPPDGGLYVPEHIIPVSSTDHRDLANLSYADFTTRIIYPYIENALSLAELSEIVDKAYGGFSHKAVVPLQQLAHKHYMLALHHGPTFSFKDYSLQVLAGLFAAVLQKQNKRICIVGATSGDTGSAAVAACRKHKNIQLVMLHPKGRISEIQRRQMSTVDEENIFNIALEGTFDDCQNTVKKLFADSEFTTETNLSAINSINWARILVQMAYYAYTSLSFKESSSYAVPTGNFGNILAAYTAKMSGFPIDKLYSGTGPNDIVHRFLTTGTMKQEAVVESYAVAMDIQIASNFERLLFWTLGNGIDTTRYMDELRRNKEYTVEDETLKTMQSSFSSYSLDNEAILAAMNKCYDETGYIIDPHTAISFSAEHDFNRGPLISVSTAHPAKFGATVQKALHRKIELPRSLAILGNKPEKYDILPNNFNVIKSYILDKLRS